MATKKQTLRAMRLDKRLTQAQVADKMKVSQSHYSSVERGEQPPLLIEIAMGFVNRMRFRSSRTDGGSQRAGRLKD